MHVTQAVRSDIYLGILVEEVEIMYEVGLFKQMEDRVSPEFGVLDANA